MAKSTLGPMCKYHNETTMLQTLVVQLGGHSFRVYVCSMCTYIEFHDNDPD